MTDLSAELTAYVDKMIDRAREILKEDRILKHLKDGAAPPVPPADPANPPAPKAKPVPDPAPAKPHWWFGETSE